MKLDPDAIREYQEAHNKDTGEELPYEVAAKRANELLELVKILMQPIPIRPILQSFLADPAALAELEQAFQASIDQEF